MPGPLSFLRKHCAGLMPWQMKKARLRAFLIISVSNFSPTWHSFHYLCHLTTSDVQVADTEGIGFDEVASWLHFLAHQGGEYFIGCDGVLDLYLE